MITYSVCRANRAGCTGVDGILDCGSAWACYRKSVESNLYGWVGLFAFPAEGGCEVVAEWRENDGCPVSTVPAGWDKIEGNDKVCRLCGSRLDGDGLCWNKVCAEGPTQGV